MVVTIWQAGLKSTGSSICICPPFDTFKVFSTFPKSFKINYTTKESPNLEFFEWGKKLGITPSLGWPQTPDGKSNNFTKTHPESSITGLAPISKLISCTTIQGFLKRYITFSWVNWLRTGEPLKFNEKKVPPLLLKLIWSLPWQVWLQFQNLFHVPLFTAVLRGM